MATQLKIIQTHLPAVCENADETAVHETRKAIRRTFTAFKVTQSSFAPGVLAFYRRRLRKMMRRLGRSRDAAVFLQKLQQFDDESSESVAELIQYWCDQKTAADVSLRLYLSKPKRRTFLTTYQEFTQTPGAGVADLPDLFTPVRVRHLAPVVIYRRVARVRAYEDHLANAEIERLHRLRIQCKELRYTLQFFTPLLGPKIKKTITAVKKLQVLLGDLNDADVALTLLDRTPGRETAVAIYRAAKEAEITQLLNAFPACWHEFNTPAWRQNLAKVLATL